MKYIGDPGFFRDIRQVRLQRQVNDAQCNYFLKFLQPLSQSIGFWIIYEIDDVIGYDDIPKYNIGRNSFKNKQFFKNIKQMLKSADFITVTTESLKKYYIKKFEIDEEKFIVIPNFLPRWWAGESYDIRDQMHFYNENQGKPRIGFPASTSHFDVQNLNNYQDDFSHLNDFIRDTVKNYQWVFIGGVPHQLEDLAKQKLIEVHKGSDILNYPRELWSKKLQMIVAPLQDNIFNRCKSNIKQVEGWGLGIPVIGQDLECYNKYSDIIFTDANSLQNQIDFVIKKRKRYKDLVEHNRYVVDFGDKNSPHGWWLEKNLQKWYNIYAISQKTLKIDLTLKDKKQKEEGVKVEL